MAFLSLIEYCLAFTQIAVDFTNSGNNIYQTSGREYRCNFGNAFTRRNGFSRIILITTLQFVQLYKVFRTMMRINIEDPKLIIPHLDGGGVPQYHYEGEPFTGIVYENDDNGILAIEKEYVNSFQEGWIRYYYSNGQKDEEYKKHHNEMIVKTYRSWDENGNLIEDHTGRT